MVIRVQASMRQALNLDVYINATVLFMQNSYMLRVQMHNSYLVRLPVFRTAYLSLTVVRRCASTEQTYRQQLQSHRQQELYTEQSMLINFLLTK